MTNTSMPSSLASKRKAGLAGSGKSKSVQSGTGAATKQPHRYRPGTVALREIRKLQKRTELLIHKLIFQRLVGETMQYSSKNDLRITASALLALQEATENFIIRFLADCNLIAINGKRITIKKRDSETLSNLRVIYTLQMDLVFHDDGMY